MAKRDINYDYCKDKGLQGWAVRVYAEREARDSKARSILDQGVIRILSAKWLAYRPSGYKIERRQDLEKVAMAGTSCFSNVASPDAFLKPAEAVQVFDGGSIMVQQRVALLSYGWLSKDHPDPDGFHFSTLRKALFFMPRVLGIFWDFASLPQAGADATEEDTALRTKGLHVMHYLYGSEKTVVWQLTHMPLACSIRPYGDRGWCFFEATVSCLLKPANELLDLGTPAAQTFLLDQWSMMNVFVRQPNQDGNGSDNTFIVMLNKTAGASLCNPHRVEDTCIRILSVKNTGFSCEGNGGDRPVYGLFTEWNRQNPDTKVLMNDCIISVNGTTTSGQAMMDIILSGTVLDIVMQRTVFESLEQAWCCHSSEGGIRPIEILDDAGIKIGVNWLIEKDIVQVGTAQRRPPLSPEHMKCELANRAFTNGKSDCSLVSDLYADFFENVVATVLELNFDNASSGSGWGDREVFQFAQALPAFAQCQILDLRFHSFGDAGLKKLWEQLPALKELRKIDLESEQSTITGIGLEGMSGKQLPALEEFRFVIPLLNQQGLYVLQDCLPQLPSLKTLTLPIHVQETSAGRAFQEIWIARCGSMETIGRDGEGALTWAKP